MHGTVEFLKIFNTVYCSRNLLIVLRCYVVDHNPRHEVELWLQLARLLREHLCQRLAALRGGALLHPLRRGLGQIEQFQALLLEEEEESIYSLVPMPSWTEGSKEEYLCDVPLAPVRHEAVDHVHLLLLLERQPGQDARVPHVAVALQWAVLAKHLGRCVAAVG